MKPLHHKKHTLAKRGLSLLCVLALCLGLLPVTALAAENDRPYSLYVGNTDVAKTEYSDNAAYWTSSDGGTNWTSQLDEPTADSYIHYDGNGTLTLHNVNISRSNENGIYAEAVSGSAVSLTINLEGTNTVSGWSGIFVHTVYGAASLSISGTGSLTAEGTGGGSFSGIQVQSNDGKAELTINNVDVTATNNVAQGIILRSGGSSAASLTVNGGELTASGSDAGIKYVFGSSGTGGGTPTVTVSGNAIVRANGGISDDSSTDIQIGADSNESNGGIVFDGSAGTVYGKVELQEDLEIGEGESLTIPEESRLTIPDDKMLTVNGGTLTGDVTGTVIYKVTDVSLDKTELTLTEGGSETLTATITPSNATNQNVAWSSDNENIATVSNGVVTAVSPGTAKITATADGKSDTCTVTVIAKTYSISVDPSTLNFGSITEGGTLPAAQEVTVKNSGNQRVTLVQPTAENFEIGKLSETTLEPDETATFTIQPKDKLPRGSYSEQITISGNDGASATLTASFTVKEPPYTGKYSYEVSTSVGDHGSLTVDRYATEGDEVTITVTPDEAYKLDDLSVTAGGKEVALTAGGDGTFSFTMPSADVKISATFAEDPDWTEPEEPATDVSDIFLDIAANAWYKDAVQYAYDNGLMTGVSAHEFAPEATTTRAMIVSMLARLEGVESAESAGFADVAANDWYATAVNWAAASGITSGTGDGNFSPNTAITREQLAAILMNYAQYKGQDVSARATLDTYNDATAISSWANDVMSWAVAEGLLTGVTNDQLQPQGNATRAQVAAILQRFLSE